MKKLEKVKAFVEKHKVTIAYFTGAAVAIGSMLVVDKLAPGRSYRVYNKNMITVLDSITKGPNRKVYVLTGIEPSAIKLNELGKLGGNVMKNSKATGEEALTHFICFGDVK